MSKYIIGVDGGGTKTLGALFNLDGLEVKRVQNGFSNFSVDETKTRRSITHTLDKLYEGVQPSDVIHIVMGIAGVSKLKNKEQFISEIESKYQTKVTVVTDAEIALYSIKKDTNDCVIMVLGGTGSVVMISENDETSFIGGFGHLLGDEGSGYHLAITALRQIIRESEENKELSNISKEILKEIGAKNHIEIKNFVYNNSKSDIARLSKFIADFALDGDPQAKQLFIQEGKHLARQAIVAFKKLDTCNRVTIGIRGGFLLHAPFVKETLIRELKRNEVDFIIDTKPVEPVIGAYYLGKKKL